MLISNLTSDLITDLISDFEIASMLNHTINLESVMKLMVRYQHKPDYMDRALTMIKHVNTINILHRYTDDQYVVLFSVI